MYIPQLFQFCLLFQIAAPTIDLNSRQLQYISDHLTLAECRTLAAAVHFKGYEKPNSLDQAARKIERDIPCVDLLHHWNSVEGRGESHTILEQRLRQMGKLELADWLGRTVFEELVADANRSVQYGLQSYANEPSTTEETMTAGPTLVPFIEPEELNKLSTLDKFLYALLCGLVLVVFALSIGILCRSCIYSLKSKKARRIKLHTPKSYDLLVETNESSESESEDQFDIRNYTSNN